MKKYRDYETKENALWDVRQDVREVNMLLLDGDERGALLKLKEMLDKLD